MTTMEDVTGTADWAPWLVLAMELLLEAAMTRAVLQELLNATKLWDASVSGMHRDRG